MPARKICITWGSTTVASLLMTALLLVMCPWLGKRLVDAYIPYSGVVRDKGTEWHWGLPGDPDRYIILEDARGRRVKRYVSAYGYAFAEVGRFVVKERGLGHYPRHPGDLPASQVYELLQKKHGDTQSKR
jgi:hypothetical protein